MHQNELLPYAPSSVDQLERWKNHQEQFPLLSHLVRIVFPVPAASSKSERVFSASGNVVTAKRASLNSEKMEDLVIVKMQLVTAQRHGHEKVIKLLTL